MRNCTPEVAVIIPSYNQAAYLSSTILTVQQQTFPDWELFIIDDGSTDSTADIVRPFLTDERVHYIKQRNQERAVARNRGLAESSAPYIAFLDADDLWHPEKLSRQIQAMKAHPDAGLCHTLTDDIDPNGTRLRKTGRSRAYSGQVFDRLLRSNFMVNSSVLIRRTSLTKVGVFDTELPVFGAEDWDLWLRIAREYSVCLVAEELTFYRLHPQNTSYGKVLKSSLAVVEKLYTGSERLPDARVTRSEARAHLYLIAARTPEISASNADRRHLLMLALRNYPLSLMTLAGAGALARTFMPSLTSTIKSWVWRLKH